MESVPENPYNQVPYLTFPMSQTHPDRLASVGTLFGMSPAPVTQCRYLEIACGDGSNIIPMAYDLSGSRFVGIDLADDAIAAARRGAAELGLHNVEFAACDLRELGPEIGEFDYIVAHGLYSWVPDDVRGRLLAVCRDRLAPHGVAFISYNAYPGRHVREMFRDMLLYHTRGADGGRDQLSRAHEFLKMLGASRMVARPWQSMVDDEIERLLNGNTAWLYHDDLAPINDSFYFRDFAARAADCGLQYLGDGEAHLMFDPRGVLAGLGDDVLEREQYLDFLYFRRLRQTLLCRDDVTLDRNAGPGHMERFLFSAPAKQADGKIEGLNSVRITPSHEIVGRVVSAMGEVYPLPVAFDELLAYAGDRDALREILFTLVSSGFAEFHVYDFPCQEIVTTRPRASRLVRWQSLRSQYVSCAGHASAQMDDMARALVQLLDGDRDMDAVAVEIARLPGAPPLDDVRRILPERLEWMAGMGMLEG
jgi:SAM-dependent methyltransferase